MPSKVLSRVMNSSSSSHNITYSKDEIFEEGKGCDYFKTVVFQYDLMVWQNRPYSFKKTEEGKVE